MTNKVTGKFSPTHHNRRGYILYQERNNSISQIAKLLYHTLRHKVPQLQRSINYGMPLGIPCGKKETIIKTEKITHNKVHDGDIIAHWCG